MNMYLTTFEWFDHSDTTTSDLLSGGPVGWKNHSERFEDESDEKALVKARKIAEPRGKNRYNSSKNVPIDHFRVFRQISVDE